MQMLSGKGEGGERSGGNQSNQNKAQNQSGGGGGGGGANYQSQNYSGPDFSDEIPFLKGISLYNDLER